MPIKGEDQTVLDGIDYAISRRQMLARTIAALSVAGLPEWFTKDAIAAEREKDSKLPKKFGPNDQINIGAIGVGGRKGGYRQGLGDTQRVGGQHGVKVVAICDLDQTHLDDAVNSFGPDTAKFHDFRELLARKDIDAVVIGTPDHWHVLVALAALKAGKHVYCEKPLTLFIEQGKKLVKAHHASNQVFQTGSQQRSDQRFRLACELVRNGRLGKIKHVSANLPTGPTGGPFTAEPVPSDFDWEMWQGPAPRADFYTHERTHGVFRWWLDYSGGMMTDWGAHHNDIAQWGLGTDRSGPVTIQAYGKGPIVGQNCYTTFPEFDVDYTYQDGVVLHTSNKGENGVEFEGELGKIFVSRGTITASDQKLLDEPLGSGAVRLYESNDHARNYIECIREGKPAICDAEIGHRSATVCHLGNISLRLDGRKLDWDPKLEQFKGDPEAQAMVSRPMHKPWTI